MKKTKKSQKPAAYNVPTSIQRLFVYTIIPLYLLQTALIAEATVSQYMEGSDYRPQLGYFIVYNLVPIAIFLLAYLLNPRKLALLGRIFESLLITVGALIGWSLLGMLMPGIVIGLFGIDGLRIIEYVSAALFLTIYTSVLIILRKRAVWS
jgi:hypothetical protein